MKYTANPVEVDAFKIVSIGAANADCSVDLATDDDEFFSNEDLDPNDENPPFRPDFDFWREQ